jgi:hypothetical protein
MTPKVWQTAKARLVVRAHLPIMSLLGLAWLSGVVLGHPLARALTSVDCRPHCDLRGPYGDGLVALSGAI